MITFRQFFSYQGYLRHHKGLSTRVGYKDIPEFNDWVLKQGIDLYDKPALIFMQPICVLFMELGDKIVAKIVTDEDEIDIVENKYSKYTFKEIIANFTNLINNEIRQN